MDLALFGRYFLDFALLYPSAFLKDRPMIKLVTPD